MKRLNKKGASHRIPTPPASEIIFKCIKCGEFKRLKEQADGRVCSSCKDASGVPISDSMSNPGSDSE